MITRHNHGKVARLISMSDASGQIFEPVGETPLASIVEDGMYSADVEIRGKSALESFTEVTSINEDVNPHDQSTQAYAELLGRGIYEQTKFARDTVVPFVRSVYERTRDKVAGVALPTYSVKSFFLADVHDNPSIFDLIAEYKDLPRSEIIRPFGFPSYSEEELIGFLRTGSSIIDADIAKMVGDHDTGWLMDTYNQYFGGNVAGAISVTASPSQMDEYLVAFLLCRKFLNELPENIQTSYPHVSFKTVLYNLIGQLGREMSATHTQWDNLKSQGHLVIEYPSCSWIPDSVEEAVIHVIGDTYNAFLDAGGVPELLIGSAVSERLYTTVKIAESKEMLLAAYQEYCNKADEMLVRNTAGIIRDSAVEAAEELQDSVRVDASEGVAGTPEDCLVTFRAILDKISNADLEDNPYSCIRIAACGSFFADTDSLNLLVRMDTYMARYEGMDARDAAYYTAADLIVEHLTTQAKPAVV